jgi:hypothetical protein
MGHRYFESAYFESPSTDESLMSVSSSLSDPPPVAALVNRFVTSVTLFGDTTYGVANLLTGIAD